METPVSGEMEMGDHMGGMDHQGMDHQGMEGHMMAGIPTWMAMAGLGLVILLSHVLLSRRREARNTDASYWRLGLLDWSPLKRLVRAPFFPLLVQSLSIGLLLLIIVAGLYGSQRHNIATVLTWTWWWALLIFIIVGFGKGFCTICPWEGLASLATSLSLRSRVKRIGFEWKWPGWARNLYPALGLFILLTWFELGYEVTDSPSTTALLGLGMAAMAVLAAMGFEGRGFCRYACLVGRVSGIYSLFSPLELRADSREVCRSCESKACLHGTEKEVGCPTFLFPGNLKENTYCTLCTECVRSCPHDNLNINFRPLAADLMEKKRFRWDEAIMAMVMLSLTSFHGATMTGQWSQLSDWVRAATGMGRLTAFTALMAGIIALPLLLFWGSAALSRLLAADPALRIGEVLKLLAYPLIPVALCYHLAHNGMHFFMEGQNLLPLLSDPLGWGWNLFGTAGRSYAPLISLEKIWLLQISLIVAGHLYGVLIADRVGRRLFRSGNGLRGLAPFIATMVLYSGFSIWLIAQPMVMRSGM